MPLPLPLRGFIAPKGDRGAERHAGERDHSTLTNRSLDYRRWHWGRSRRRRHRRWRWRWVVDGQRGSGPAEVGSVGTIPIAPAGGGPPGTPIVKGHPASAQLGREGSVHVRVVEASGRWPAGKAGVDLEEPYRAARVAERIGARAGLGQADGEGGRPAALPGLGHNPHGPVFDDEV